jgi:hypothetical protein
MSKQLYIDLKKMSAILNGYSMSSGYDSEVLKAISFIDSCIDNVVACMACGAEDISFEDIKNSIDLFYGDGIKSMFD